MAYIYDLTDTWNASGTTFNGIKLNVTDSASASSSKLVTLQTNGTEHFSITKAGVGYVSGNLGVGTASPATKLHLLTASATAVALRAGNSVSYAEFQVDASGNSQLVAPGGVQIFNTNGSERMRITSGGNVGIGTSIPGSYGKLAVFGSVANQSSALAAPDASTISIGNLANDALNQKAKLIFQSNSNSSAVIAGYYAAFNGSADTATGLLFATQANAAGGVLERMRIDSSGNVGIGTSSPTTKVQVFSDGAPAASGNMNTGMAVASAAGSFAINIGANATGGYTWLNSAYINASQIASPMVFMTGATERARINSSGLVGIGTSSPQVGLHISFADQSTNRIRIQNTGASGGNFDIIGGLAGASNVGLSFYDVTNAATRMYIDSSGRVLIGTTATVGGTWSNEVKQTSSGVWPWGLNCVDRGLIVRNSSASSGFYAYFEYNGGTNNGSISWSGGTTAYNTTSDARIKDNIVDAPDAGDLIDAIQVRSWDFKADGAHWRYGMVAQELLEVAPEAVNKPEDEEMMMGVDYSKLVPMLIKEVQSLRARVAQLEGN